MRVKIRRRGIRTPLPALTFGNVGSLRNKTELSANCKYLYEYRESAIIALTETWLQDRDADGIYSLDGFVLIRSDRGGVDKDRGGGVAVYINEKWCSQVNINEKYCDKDIEYLVISCHPFYLPREFVKVVLIIVYIPTDADVSAAAEILESCVSKYENRWDFNACDFQEKIPAYEQSMKCNTRGNNTFDKLYCIVKSGYRAFQRPQLGNSNHNMIFCAPTYKQVLKREPCKVVTYRKWDPENTARLQACLECTDWNTLIENGTDISGNMDIFNAYFNFCLDMLIPTKDMKIYPNNKPWINKKLISLLNEKCRIRQSGNINQKKELQKRINKKITDSKEAYKKKLKDFLWQIKRRMPGKDLRHCNK